MVDITPITQKGILLRVVFLIVIIEINSKATNFIQDPNNNVFKQAQPLKFSLHIFLLLPLAELGIFAFANVFAQHRFGSAGMWSKACLFAFLIGVCPAVCVMEYHRMKEVEFFYGKWLCLYDYVPLESKECMRECPIGNNRTLTCVRERKINNCFHETWSIIPSFPIPEPFSFNNSYMNSSINGFWTEKDQFEEYPEFEGMYLCIGPPHERVEGRGAFKGCDVNKYTERLDQNNFWTFLCYYRQKEDVFIYLPNISSDKLCSQVKNMCRFENVTDFYPSMKVQCRLADLYVILSVTFACWILPNFALKSGVLPTLLLTNMLTAADIFDLLNCFDEPLAPIRSIWRTVICVWPTSLLHLFCNNISSTVVNSTDAENGWDDSESHSSASLDSRSDYSGSDSLGSDSGSWSGYVEETNNQRFSQCGSSKIDTCQSNSSQLEDCLSCLSSVIITSGVLEIILSALLQDLPFLCVRCYLLSRVNRYNPQIYFFAAKNALFTLVQVFRASVLLQHRLICTRC